MSDLIEIQNRQNQLRELLAEMRELNQPRSNFALRHFVVGQHDMPARQRQQVIIELQALMFELANQSDEIRLSELDIQDLNKELEQATEENQKERIRIRIGQKQRAIESQSLFLTGRLRECDTLYAMLKEMPKVTAEQFEAEEEAYWSARLSRQYILGQRDVGGNLTAVLQMLTEPGTPRPELEARLHNVMQVLGLSDDAIKKLGAG
jgi:small-conductance mechanosensitive channel